MSACCSLRRILPAVQGTLVLWCSVYAAGGSITAPRLSGIDVVKLPVIDKHDIHFTRFSADEESFQGESRIVSITRDNYGFLWLAGHGLHRYDGYNLKTYWHDPGDPNSLSDDNVSVIFKDRAGILWAGTFGGLDRLDLAQGTVTHYRHDPGD